MRTPVYLAGPTAVGKSAVALDLARRLDGEIISVDSMQVYRGMDIGTAKPSVVERASVAHHLIDVVDLTTPFDVAEFVKCARAAFEAIRARGKTPIFCGGTGLYFKAYLEGLGEGPPSDPALRRQLEAQPLEKLLAELETRDPVTYARIDRTNPRRVYRALEVVQLTGRSYSEQRASWRKVADEPPGLQPLFFGLARELEDLRKRIESRVDSMFRQGFVEEVRRLASQGLAENRTAAQALGYRQVLGLLGGAGTEAETIAEVKTRTRQFARRQRTWFRTQMSVRWIQLTPESVPSEVAAQLADAYAQFRVGSSCG